MIDYKKEASSFLSKNNISNISKFSSNKISCTVLNFTEIKLTTSEEENIRLILNGSSDKNDVNSLLELTIQVKAIQKQGVILLGEKIFRAREIINKNSLKKTSFSSWINMFFKTKSSAYNALAYYELYVNLPTEKLKSSFLEIPYKAAYKLSSKSVCLKDKERIIPHIVGLSNSEAISLISKLSANNSLSRDYDNEMERVSFNKIKSLLISVFGEVVSKRIKDSNRVKEILKILKMIEHEVSNN